MKKNFHVQMNPIPTQQYSAKNLNGGSSKYLDDTSERHMQSEHDLYSSQHSYKQDQQINLNEIQEQYDDIQSGKLPQLSDVINMKFRQNIRQKIFKQYKYSIYQILGVFWIFNFFKIDQQKKNDRIKNQMKQERRQRTSSINNRNQSIVKYKNREIERLQYLIKYLTIAQQKRDEMLSHIQEENRKLKEQNAYLENVNKRPFSRVI